MGVVGPCSAVHKAMQKMQEKEIIQQELLSRHEDEENEQRHKAIEEELINGIR